MTPRCPTVSFPPSLVALASVGLAACIGAAADADTAGAPAAATSHAACEVVAANMALPAEVRETSGLARGRRDPDVFWTHNDAGGRPELFGIDAAGRLVRRVRVTGATHVDWEDIEAAPCGDASCLYIGDIGDNGGDRDHITIYRIAEPTAGAVETEPAAALHARFPDGAADAEALFADASGDLYVITKGRHGAVALYRYPAPQRPGETVTLVRVRELFPQPRDAADRVTAAAATPDGRRVGIRTYRTLFVHATSALLGDGALQPATADLAFLGEAQGESLVLANDGTVWVTSEAGRGGRPRWSRLHCALPDA